MLAVLKAGGAYVPVDPDYPHDRVSFILRDSDVPLVVAQSGVLVKVSFMTLAGLGEREADCVVTGARAQIKELDRLPLPDRDSIDIDRYRRQGFVPPGIVWRNTLLSDVLNCSTWY